MNRIILYALLAASIPAVATDAPVTAPITYEVAAVDGKLLLEIEPDPRRLQPGDRPVSGDRLRTGRWSTATIGLPSHTTVFHLDAKTSCTLAGGRPGVLLHVERGRLRAIFGSFAGPEPRLVTTPSAVLAVRGTDYGVKVAKDGDTRIVVFAGVVEVADPDDTMPPVLVEAGEQTRVRSGRPVETPQPHRLTPHDWDRGYDSPPPGSGSGGAMTPNDRGTGFGESAGAGANSRGGSKRRGG